uniref:Secreted protein n=1 Tax=Globodera pallida TaxID=36090 RepID=A0A183BX58_GLOPA
MKICSNAIILAISLLAMLTFSAINGIKCITGYFGVPTTTTPQYFFGFQFGPYKIEPPCETDCHFGIQLGPVKKK